MTAVAKTAGRAHVKSSDPDINPGSSRTTDGTLDPCQECRRRNPPDTAVLQVKELARLGVGQVHGDQLQDEIDLFERAVPGREERPRHPGAR